MKFSVVTGAWRWSSSRTIGPASVSSRTRTVSPIGALGAAALAEALAAAGGGGLSPQPARATKQQAAKKRARVMPLILDRGRAERNWPRAYCATRAKSTRIRTSLLFRPGMTGGAATAGA